MVNMTLDAEITGSIITTSHQFYNGCLEVPSRPCPPFPGLILNVFINLVKVTACMQGTKVWRRVSLVPVDDVGGNWRDTRKAH